MWSLLEDQYIVPFDRSNLTSSLTDDGIRCRMKHLWISKSIKNTGESRNQTIMYMWYWLIEAWNLYEMKSIILLHYKITAPVTWFVAVTTMRTSLCIDGSTEIIKMSWYFPTEKIPRPLPKISAIISIFKKLTFFADPF